MDLLDRLRLERPIVQAPLGGGLAGAELAAAVSRAGGLGTIGIVSPPRLVAEIRRARELAPGRPLGAGLLMPFVRRAHVDACIDARLEAVVVFFGYDAAMVARLRDAGIVVLHQVGTAAEARRALADGADALVAQGREAGGHLLGTRDALGFLPEALEVAAGRPVIVAGGVARASDLRAALGAGASAAMAGTRFLCTDECRAHPGYKRRVVGASRTIETELFGFGWPARHRVLPNAATERWCRADGAIPLALARALRATASLGRIAPLGAAGALPRLQRASVPFFSPAAPRDGDDESRLEVAPLYAGESAVRIDAVVPAERAVRELAP